MSNLEKAKKKLKDHAAISGFDLPDDGFIMKMLEFAAEKDTDYNVDDVCVIIKSGMRDHRSFDEFEKLKPIIETVCHDEFRYNDGIDMIEEYFAEIVSNARLNGL